MKNEIKIHKKNYKIVPPKQKYMDLPKIYATYGSTPVVAYKCKVVADTPMGGYVVAVLNEPDESSEGLKAYLRQLKNRFAAKEPIYYISIREDALIYDNGSGEVKGLPAIVLKEPSEVERAVNNIPDELIARALASALFADQYASEEDDPPPATP